MTTQRLLVIASTFPASEGDGTPPFVRDLAAYEARHFETRVLVPRVPGGAAQETHGDLDIRRFAYFPRRWEALAHGAIIENLRAHKAYALQVPALLAAEAAALRQQVKEFRPDVVHVHWVVPQGVVALVAARGVPMVVTTLGGDVYALNAAPFRRLKGAVLKRASSVTTMNRDMRQRLIDLGADPERTHVLPMGADVRGVRRNGEGVAKVPGRILFAGRLVEKKGANVLFDALRRLPDDGTWSLDVIGDGPLRNDLEKAAAGLPVRFLGQATRPELAKAMAASEVFVVPSVPASSGDQDGLPVVLLEAMGAGCAIVASRLAGIDEAVADGESGVLVPPGDAPALAAAIDALMHDPDRRHALGQAASARGEEFSVESIGARYVGLLKAATIDSRP